MWRAPVVYVAFTSLFGFIVPIVAIIVLYVLIVRAAVRERLREHPRVASQAYTDCVLQPDSRFWLELNTSKYVGVLVVIWAVLRGPYLLLSYSHQFQSNGPEDSDGLTYPWQVELALTWIYLSFPTLLPLVTFCWRKEVWQKFKNLILCRKSNLINDSEPRNGGKRRKPLAPAEVAAAAASKEPLPSMTDINRNTSIPVLFATEDGLHFQSYGNRAMKDDESSEEEDTVGELENTKASKIATTRKCDVYGSQLSLKNVEGEKEDTSDYNSSGEGDRFSKSNPLPASELKKARRRSKSQTARQNSEINDDKVNAHKRRRKTSSENNQVSETDPELGARLNSTELQKNKKNRKSHRKAEKEVIENAYEKDVDGAAENKETQAEHHRTSSDSGQGSHEGSMSKKSKARVDKASGFHTNPEDRVYEISPEIEMAHFPIAQGDNTSGQNQIQTDRTEKVTVVSDAVNEETPGPDARKKRRRKKKQVNETSADDTDKRRLPELRHLRRPEGVDDLYFAPLDQTYSLQDSEQSVSLAPKTNLQELKQVSQNQRRKCSHRQIQWSREN